MKDDSILHNEFLVEVLAHGVDGFLTMAVAVVDHSASKQHRVVSIDWTPTLALVNKVTAKVDGPTMGRLLKPPQVIGVVIV